MRQRTAGVVVIVLLGVLAILLFAPPKILLDPAVFNR